VFVDIDPRTFNIDPLLIEPAITGRTRAILPVHLYGQACQMGPIMDIALEHGLKVIEDCAQAMGGAYKGRKVGTFGDAAALSFFPSKNLGGFGDGGMIVTSDAEVAELARMLRAHGAKRKYDHEMLGYNSRLDELQAALLRIRLPHLDRLNEGRRAAAAAYGEELAGNEFVTVPLEDPDAYHVFHQYTVRVPQGRRDSVRAALGASGIDTMIYYPIPGDATVALQAPAVLPVAGVAAGEVLSLPMSAELGPAVARRLAASLG
jgi:dTDP-4-amino-4,6-dideoxygalactose transaminase